MRPTHPKSDFRFTETPKTDDSQYFRRELEAFNDYVDRRFRQIEQQVEEGYTSLSSPKTPETTTPKPTTPTTTKVESIIQLSTLLENPTVIPIGITAIAGTGLTLRAELTLIGDLTIV